MVCLCLGANRLANGRGALLANSQTSRSLSRNADESAGSTNTSNLPRWTQERYVVWNRQACGLFAVASALFYLSFVFPLEHALSLKNRVLTYWRAMHLTSGVSPIVPIFSLFVGFYLWHWLTLHGLALFGPDRPCLPLRKSLVLKDEKGNAWEPLRMFSQECAADEIERAVAPWDLKVLAYALGLLLALIVLAFWLAQGVPIRSLGSQNYALIFLVCLAICSGLLIAETCRLFRAWEELRKLLTFLDRLPLRRTFATTTVFPGEAYGG